MPIPVGRARGAGGKAGGEQDNQQMQVVPRAHLTARQTVLWAVFEHGQTQKDGLSTSPQEIWNGYIYPGAKTPCSQCRGPGFDFWSGN